jgi:Uma2 family endonuclease
LTEKLGWYRQYGVREAWLVDTEAAQVTRIDCTGAQPDLEVSRGVSSIHSAVLPELRIRAVAIF